MVGLRWDPTKVRPYPRLLSQNLFGVYYLRESIQYVFSHNMYNYSLSINLSDMPVMSDQQVTFPAKSLQTIASIVEIRW